MATTNNSAAQAGTATKKRGQFKETWRRLKKNRMAMIGPVSYTHLDVYNRQIRSWSKVS